MQRIPRDDENLLRIRHDQATTDLVAASSTRVTASGRRNAEQWALLSLFDAVIDKASERSFGEPSYSLTARHSPITENGYGVVLAWRTSLVQKTYLLVDGFAVAARVLTTSGSDHWCVVIDRSGPHRCANFQGLTVGPQEIDHTHDPNQR